MINTKKNNLGYSCIVVALFIIWITPYNISHIVSFIFQVLKLLSTAIIILFYITYRAKKKVEFSSTILFCLIYCLSIIVTTIINHSGYTLIIKSLVEACTILGIFMFLLMAFKYSSRITISALYFIITVYLIIDIAIIIFLPNGITLNVNNEPVYFDGGKFTVCYLYILWCIFIYLKNYIQNKKIRNWKKLIIILLGVSLAIKMSCSTGLIGILILGIIILFPNLANLLGGFNRLLVFIILLNYLIIVTQIQTKVPALSYFIISILHENMSFTGRFRIYSEFFYIMSNHWVYGYGYGTDIINRALNLANAQNGFLQIICTSGFLGLGTFLVFIFKVTSRSIEKCDAILKPIFIGSILAFLVCAIVEISFGYYFYLLLAICMNVWKIENYSEKVENNG